MVGLGPENSAAQTSKGTPPQLNEQILNQIIVLGQEKKSRTPAQRKMSSQLVHAVKLRRGDQHLRRVSGLKPRINIAGDDTTLVDITASVSPELLEKIEVLGGSVMNSFSEYDAVRARLPLDAVEILAARDDVSYVRPASRAFLKKASTSEGDVAHRANTARERYLLTGRNIKTGERVKVGVMSDSVDSLSLVQSLGDLPSVTVLDDAPGNTGEGTAMLEIIHDLAPDAQLYFASGWKSKASFASNIKTLANAGCQVIVDDLGYLDESPFQDDIISQAVNTVTAQGVLYFSSAGNAGNLNSGTSGVWEGDYSSQLTVLGGEVVELHNFGGGDWSNKILTDDGCYTLFWSDPLGKSSNDYDLYLLDPSLSMIVAESSGYQEGAQDPLEGFCLGEGEDVANYNLLISRFSGQNRFLHLSANRGRLEHNTDGQIYGHPAATDAFAVAAVDAQDRSIPFVGTEQVGWYSSDGPRRVFYSPNGTPYTPGNLSSTGGRVRYKPDVAAADCIKTSTPGFETFCGTSASVAHAGAIAALILSGKPDLTVAEVRQAIQTSVFDIERPGWDRNSGYGLIMADRVLEEIGPFRILNPGIFELLLKK